MKSKKSCKNNCDKYQYYKSWNGECFEDTPCPYCNSKSPWYQQYNVNSNKPLTIVEMPEDGGYEMISECDNDKEDYDLEIDTNNPIYNFVEAPWR